MKEERIPQILSFEQLAKQLAESINNKIPSTKLESFKGLPVCRTDYFQLQKGNLTLSLKTLNKVCVWLELPQPKIYL